MDCNLVHTLIYFWGRQLVGLYIYEELIIGLVSITLYFYWLFFCGGQLLGLDICTDWISLGDLIYKTNNDVGLCIDVTAELLRQLGGRPCIMTSQR